MTDVGTDRYELYRVITDMDALHEGFRDRVEELQATRLEIDAAGKLQPGYSAKLLCDPPIKSFGRESLPRMLKATGMALVLVIDDQRFAITKAQLAKRKRPNRAIVRRVIPKWLFKPEKAREMGKKRWLGVSDAERTRIMKRVSKAALRARRRKARLQAQEIAA
jgi:hypothetical protein